MAATAEALPFSSGYFDAAIMVLCLHHLSDWHRAIREALRVSASGPLVIFAFDTEHDRDFWLFDYFPGLLEIDQRWQPSLNQLCEYVEQELGGSAERFEFPLPNNLVDHFASADWARPEAYLDQTFRSGISSFLRLDAAALEQGVERLQQELQTGKWDARYGQLRQLEELDRGYSFIRIRLTSRA